jgi:hypothetical protein
MLTNFAITTPESIGLSPCRYPNNWLESAGREGRHETGAL